MPQLTTHLAATVISSGLRIKRIPINRGQRYAEESKMNFFSLTLHGFRALMVFTEEVLVRVGTVCILIAIIAAIFSIIVVVLKIIGFHLWMVFYCSRNTFTNHVANWCYKLISTDISW